MNITMSRPSLFEYFYLALLCCSVSIGRTDGLFFKKSPNIIVIMADDMGWNDVSFHGSNEIPTPNIDALAYNGLIFANHYVLPVCTPSRTAFYTGRYPIREGMQGTPLLPGEKRGVPLATKFLPEYLQKLGYSTNLVGKWHVGYSSNDYTPVRRGFDTFFGYYNGFLSYFDHMVTGSNQTGYDMHRDTPQKIQPDWTGINDYATDLFTDEAIRIIEGHKRKKPLYLHVAHLATHASDNPNEPLETRNFAEVNQTFSYIKDTDRRKYAGMMTALDDSVGRIMQALSKKNILKNSIVIFMSDNGAKTFGKYANSGSNYPLRGLKGSLYQGAVHGVACLYSPLFKNTGRIVNDYIHVTDWLPTLYAAGGGNVRYLGIIDGVNQWPTISKRRVRVRDSMLVNIDENTNMSSAIIGAYKLIKGNTVQFNGYYGSNADDNDPTAPPYNETTVATSLTSCAIYETTQASVSPKKMLQLRSANKISCKHSVEFATCSERCLFNIDVDPCETTDISRQHPGLVEMLESYINIYQQVLVKQASAVIDPKSFPQNFNGTWMPWLD